MPRQWHITKGVQAVIAG